MVTDPVVKLLGSTVRNESTERKSTLYSAPLVISNVSIVIGPTVWPPPGRVTEFSVS